MIRSWLLFALLGSLSGCHSCSNDKPYTPFGVTSALPTVASVTSATPLPSASAHEVDAGATSLRKAVLAPAAAKQWNLDGRALDAPAGRVFEQAIVADFDQDQKNDVAAWTLPEAGAPPESAAGELWLFPASGEARRVLEFPAFLPTGASCTTVTALYASTLSTVTADIRVACTTQLVGRAPTRALAVVEPFNATPLRFGVRAADAAPDEILSLELLPEDEDNDGRADFGLRVGVGQSGQSPAAANATGGRAGAPAEVFALFQFLDRAAGVSRDASQPNKSLLAALKSDMARALKKKTADVALAHVEQTRRLLASACAEGATARVFDWSGAPLSCAPLGDLVDRLGAIEVSAELALSHFAGALAALTRDGWYFGAMRKTTRAQAEKDIDKHVTSRGVSRVELTTRARSAPSPGRAPIAFSADGSLLIEAPNGLFQVHPNELRPELIAESDAGAAWPNDASLGTGERWLAATYSCDRSEVSLLLAGASDAVRKLPLLAPRPGVCAGARFDPHFAPQVAGLEPSFEVLVGGALLRAASEPHSFPAGVARSADGKSLVIPTPLGLWIESDAPALWKSEGFAEHMPDACVVANGADRVACVRNGRVELYLKTDPSTLGAKP